MVLSHEATNAQMKQAYLDTEASNEIYKISFYSASEGYVAFQNWLGYTADTGKTFTKKYITASNVNYNGYSVNLTFGFTISGVKAFGQNTILVYGDYGFVPAILYSTNGGTSFTLVYHSQYNPLQFKTGITDMIFSQGNSIGYAIDADRILKTINGGLTWQQNATITDSYFTNLEAPDNLNVFAISTQTGRILKTNDGGTNWALQNLPVLNEAKIGCANFLTATTGWLNMYDNNNKGYIFKTINGGSNWQLQNNIDATTFLFNKMKFVDANTGYGLSYQNTIYKTTDGGVIWEPLPRDNNYAYFFYSHKDLYFFNTNQFWAGGAHGFLEYTTNAGGTPLPKAYFNIDTSGLYNLNVVNLRNYSNMNNTFKWYLNDLQLSTSYNSNYNRDISRLTDKITLIAINGEKNDTLTRYVSFSPPIIINSFTPKIGGEGTVVTIYGSNFNSATNVKFGGIAATSFSVINNTTINATVGSGASGSIQIASLNNVGSLAGFAFISPPSINSFSPTSANAGTLVIISGLNFTGATGVSFGNIQASSFTIVNSTTIAAVTPSGGSGNIIVTTPGGIASLTGYVALPKITSFSPSNGTIGTVVNITGTSLLNVTAVTVGGVSASTFTINSAKSITAIVGAGSSGNIQVSYTGGISFLPGFSWFAPPVITSFSPTAGAAGTTVTITGTGFSNSAASNLVRFGSVITQVTSASATSLTVSVPAGASFQPITVTANGLIGSSTKPFQVTFPDGGSISPSSFTSNPPVILGNIEYAENVALTDYDNDGKNDMAVGFIDGNNGSRSGIKILRNTSQGNTVSFSFSSLLIGDFQTDAAVSADFDGDGKLDVVLNSYNYLNLYKNISVPGNISFDSSSFILTNTYGPQKLCAVDVDGDGKIDIVSSNSYGAGIFLYKNISNLGKIVFNDGIYINAERSPKNILGTDLNGDGKPEIILSGTTILKNLSTPNNISFDSPLSINSYSFSLIVTGDIDGDGKTDIVSNNSRSSIAVLRNTGAGGSISFAEPVEIISGSYPTGIALSDLDGDGKTDISVGLYDYKIAVHKNTSTPGNVSFSSRFSYQSGIFNGENIVAISDVNNDGRADILVTEKLQFSLTIFTNTVKPEPFINSFTPTIGIAGTAITITGGNFTGVSSVSIGGAPATTFSINSSSSITAIAGAGETGDIVIVNSFGTAIKSSFVFGLPPSIASFTPLIAPVNSTVTIFGSNFSNSVSGNTVFFGGAKSTIISANSNRLVVKVPYGSEYKPISVTCNNQTAYSTVPFTTTFPGALSTFSNESFAPKADFELGLPATLCDIDGDGKLDLINPGFIFRNISLSGTVAFNLKQVLSQLPNSKAVATGDLDGDGKQDIAVIGSNYKLGILRNKSLPGNILFDAQIDFELFEEINDITITDVDNDGKPDILIANASKPTLTIFKNKSKPGNLMFEESKEYPLGIALKKFYFFDIDGDKQLEIVGTGYNSGSFLVYHNKSTPGNISFGLKTKFGETSGEINIADMDLDGKLDINFCENNKLSVYRNTSSTGNISFATKVDFYTGNSSFIFSLANNDLDGDGKPDIFISNYEMNILSVFKNNSTPGNITVLPKFDFIDQSSLKAISGDLDNNGKADLVVVNIYGNTSVILNQIGGTGPSIFSFSPVSGVLGTAVNIVGNGFSDATSVRFGDVSSDSFVIHSDNLITAFVGNGGSGNVSVTSNNLISASAGFSFNNLPAITGITPAIGSPGTEINITGANFNNVSAVSIGGKSARSFLVISPTSIIAIVNDNIVSDSTVKVLSGTDSAQFKGFLFYKIPTIFSFTPDVAGESYVVTINGSNFTDVTDVSLGNVPASTFNVISSSVIEATTTGIGTTEIVSVKTPGGEAIKGGFKYGGFGTITGFYPKSGTNGSQIMIAGKNLGGVTEVKFGETPASSFIITSLTSITAIVQAGSTGSVTVSGPNGPTSLEGFTYIPPASPGIVGVLPAVAASGTTVIISGMNLSNVIGVSFGGIPASSFTIVSSTKIKATVAAGNSGNVLVTTPNGVASFSGFSLTSAPYISYFYPKAANIGGSVTITGDNFSTVPSNNIVYFGTAKALVVSAFANKLVVRIPAFATYAKISVTKDNLTGYSPIPFIPTFRSDGNLNAATFNSRTDLVAGKLPGGLALADVTLDGKADLSVANFGGKLDFFKNTSVFGKIIFDAKSDLAEVYGVAALAFSDFDGDGLLDICSSNTSDMNTITVKKNLSSANQVLFGSSVQLNPGISSSNFKIADFDNDGKPDIAALSLYTGASVFKNISTPSAISFNSRLLFSVPLFSSGLAVSDIDGDGKIDLIVAGQGNIAVLKNNSTLGNISFEGSRIFPVYGYAASVSTADLNGDGFPEIISLADTKKRLAILKNISIPGFVSFEQQIDLPNDNVSGGTVIADIDGDGKLDIVISDKTEGNAFSVYKNIGLGNNISFDSKIDYFKTSRGELIIGDVDGDGSPEIINANPSSNSISIFKNTMTSLQVFDICRNGNSALISNISGASYQWQVNSGNGFVNLNNNSNYTGTNESTLQISNIQSMYYGYKYRCKIGNKYSNISSFKFGNIWTGAINSSWENPGNWSCNQVPDLNTDVIITNGNIVLNSIGNCRSIAINPSVIFTITAGNRLIISR